MGRVYKQYSPKWIFLGEIIIFEIGSAMSGAAPNSTIFIIGRAISGLGSAGIMSGLMIIMFMTVPLQKRPLFQGLFGAVFGVASVIGPLLGGAFTDELTWRWCFYINLPIGAVTIVVIALILHLPQQAKTAELSWKQRLLQLDPLGNLFLLPGVVSLLLALQWGGTTYAWRDARIIVLLILFGVLILGFVAIQAWKGDAATTPPRIVKNRSIAAGMAYNLCGGATMMTFLYYLPLYFQAIKGVTAVQSGIRTIPLVLSLVVGSIGSGAAVSRLGYYTPFMIASTIIMSIGAGLLCTLQVGSSHATWIGYQVVFGLGLGLGLQQPLNAAQTVLGKADISIGSAVMFFARFFGGAIFLAVAENLFTNRLLLNLEKIAGLDAPSVVNAGATGIRAVVPSADLAAVLVGYNDALRHTFHLGAGLSSATIIGALAMEWRSVKAAQSLTAAQSTGKLSEVNSEEGA